MVNNLKSKLRISRFRKEPSVAILIMYNSKIADLNFIIKKIIQVVDFEITGCPKESYQVRNHQTHPTSFQDSQGTENRN